MALQDKSKIVSPMSAERIKAIQETSVTFSSKGKERTRRKLADIALAKEFNLDIKDLT